MPLYAVSQLIDKEQIEAFLSVDNDYAAYALGDLEPPYEEHATWIAASRTGEIEGLALVYAALEPAVLFLMGEASAIGALLMHGVGPDVVFYTAKPDLEPLLGTFYTLGQVDHMYRMHTTRRLFVSLDRERKYQVEPLNASHTELIAAFTQEGASADDRVIAFSAEMVDEGYFQGIFQDNRLVAVAGTHLVARQASVAAVGNVLVHPDYRGKGLGTLVSEAVTQAVWEAGFKTIVLNVKQDNTAAVTIYQKLGYRVTGEFIEGTATRW